MTLRFACLTSALALATAPALAETNFNRIASFPVVTNMAAGEDTARETSSEIVAASEDGLTLVYTDSPLGVLGMIDLTDPAAPKPLGNIAMNGEPTSVVIVGAHALAGVNTSESFAAPSGRLVAVDLATRKEVASCDLGGQPDSVARAKDGSFIAVAVENERDEEVNDGALPQMPAGFVVRLPLKDGLPDCGAAQKIDLTGLAAIGGDDPEPEFVAINDLGEIVVTLQENNHIAVIGADGAVAAHFSAGAVTLEGIDATDERGALIFAERLADVAREPDAVKWIDADHFTTANEGDYKGGSRGFTIWRKDGTVVYESGPSFERAVAQIGHYPDKRSDAKGVEPESIDFARFGDMPLLFVGAERASVVGVYDVTDPAAPVLRQILPSGVGPEGFVALPDRGLLISANEADLGADGGARSHVMVYQMQEGSPAYPTITAAGCDVAGFGALSGLAADPEVPGKLYAVNDSFFGFQPTIFTIDATQTPARITAALPVTAAGMPAQKLDLEGITPDGKGGFWLASEGNADKMVPHGIVNVNAKGAVKKEIGLPAALLAGQTRFGLEGIAKVGDVLWMAVQREWGDDPKGMVKLLAYNLEAEEWGAVHYPLEPKGAGWMGLSEITIHGDHAYIVERDNLIGDAAKVKKLFRVKLADLVPAKLGETLPVVTKQEVRDLIPDLKGWGGYVQDKVEGFAIDAAGTGYVVTDNDGVDDASGETLFWSIGKVE
ncbi:esterase-like activity of phytase family protein [Candidatus Falkowbacteria bacterium]|nr:esterase-like activity of phytase family protein [Candidatus Falkowbacteria bacterium]